MARAKKRKSKGRKNVVKLTPTGRPKKIIPPHLAKARNLRASLNRRVALDLRNTTPTIPEIEKWVNRKSYSCHYCLIKLIIDDITVDHKTPLFRGGNNQLDNLCIACSSCNTIKGSLNEEEFRQLLQLVNQWEDSGEYILRRLKMGNNIYKK